MAREMIKNSNGFTKKDAINSRNGIALQEIENGQKITIKSAAILKTMDEETGEDKNVGVICTAEHDVYTCISPTIIDALSDVIDLLDDGENIEVKILKRKSKQGREFLTLTIL